MSFDSVVILSCPHSGSSLISEAVAASGWRIPGVRAHFEPSALVHLNDKIYNNSGDPALIEESIKLFIEDLNKTNIKKLCLKDPQLCETIARIAPHMKDVRFIINFRRPDKVISHIFKVRREFSRHLSESECLEWAIDEYISKNASIIEFFENNKKRYNFMFLQYDEIIALNESAIDDVSRLIGVHLNTAMVNPMRSSKSVIENSDQISRALPVFRRLVDLKQQHNEVVRSSMSAYKKSAPLNHKIKFYYLRIMFKLKSRVRSWLADGMHDNHWVRPK